MTNGTSLAGRSILIVEDEPLIVFELQVLLEEQGATAVVANTLANALTLAEHTGELSGAIIDFQMKDNDCSALCAELRAHGIPFMFYTGDAHGLATHGAPIVTKPAGAGEILGALLPLIIKSANRHDILEGAAKKPILKLF